MVEKEGRCDWRDTFVKWVQSLGKLDVWDPQRKRDAIVKSDGNGGLVIKPTGDETYPISPEDASTDYVLRISRDQPPNIAG